MSLTLANEVDLGMLTTVCAILLVTNLDGAKKLCKEQIIIKNYDISRIYFFFRKRKYSANIKKCIWWTDWFSLCINYYYYTTVTENITMYVSFLPFKKKKIRITMASKVHLKWPTTGTKM